jgi:2-keto-3-deoxy-L-rhamnonate aldolase RhmA
MFKSLPERLRRGHALGSWCTFRSFASTELMVQLGYDFLIFDLQHTEVSLSDFPALLGAFNGSDVASVARVPQNDYHAINWCLDQGFAGVLVPSVNNVEEARRAIAAAKFPPTGRRSFGPYRAAAYGRDLVTCAAQADQATALILQLESAEAVASAAAIAALPGVDAVLMGPNDLAFSLLQPGQQMLDATAGSAAGSAQLTTFARTPRVLELCAQVMADARAANVPFGMTAGNLAEARQWLERGASFATFGSDWSFLRSGATIARPPNPLATPAATTATPPR